MLYIFTPIEGIQKTKILDKIKPNKTIWQIRSQNFEDKSINSYVCRTDGDFMKNHTVMFFFASFIF